MEYVCRVGTPSGDVVERAFTAPDERALRAELEQQGLYLLSVRRGLSLSAFRFRKPRVDPAKLLVFSQELAALLKAGLPLFQSLDVMLDRQRDPVLRQSLTHGAPEGQVRDRPLRRLPAGGGAVPADLLREPRGGGALGQPRPGPAALLVAPAPQPDAAEEGRLRRRLPDRAPDDDGRPRHHPPRLGDPPVQELLRGPRGRAAAGHPHAARAWPPRSARTSSGSSWGSACW